MFEGLLNLEVAAWFGGGSIGNLLASWEQMGVFDYALPFLLIFAIVFGILSKINVFGDNKGLNAVIAFVIGLLALQFQLVPVFFSEIFPRLGVALSILLTLIILVGLFFDTKSNKIINYGLLIIAIIIFIVILTKSTGNLGWYSGYWWSSNWQQVVAVIAFFGIIAAIINSVGGGGTPQAPPLNLNFGRP